MSIGHAEAQGLACWWCSPNKYLLNEWMGEEMANLKCHLLQEVFLKGRRTQLFREEGSVSDAGGSCDAGLGPSCLHGSPGSSLPGMMSVGLSIALSCKEPQFLLMESPFPGKEDTPFETDI